MPINNAKGFTIIELMIVVAIIGMLATIGILQFNEYRAKALNTASLTDLRHLRLELEAHHAEHQRYPY